jgi:hypothetical protein
MDESQQKSAMTETASFMNGAQIANMIPNQPVIQQTFGSNLLMPVINFQNLVLSPPQQKELFFSPQMSTFMAH